MPVSKHVMSFHRLRSIFYFVLLGIFGALLLYVVRPFFYPIFWAAVIAIMFYPVYVWLTHHTKMPSVSSLLSVMIVVATLLVPMVLISVLVVYQTSDLYDTVSQNNFFVTNAQGENRFLSYVEHNAFFAPYLETIRTEWTAYITNVTRSISGFLFNKVTALTGNIIRFAFMTFIMLYTLYYFFKDGKKILDTLAHLSPLGNKYENMLYQRFTSTVRSTLKSTLVIGGIQGTMGGLLFWATGVQGAFVWGVIMVILSIIPAIGSFLVWFPAGLIMIALGNVWQGLTVLIVGTVLISNIDNFLRPKMIEKDIQMHPLLVLFSTLGGLALFEISGFVIGPVVAALFLAVLAIYDQYYKLELKKN
ncbi:MAG: AI-2E family transporter [Candidatus Magasanikbacteria bacterium]|uniref:AI-2E family transporter n=1 Tax=Candidatus Magasanikbacteria bacterium CG10_big_fil_rev_8_21_14_0_10_38_6 TaxID=1974647 RepID=A0A2M6NZE3_9BACT|nr:AI-2E family transporter [Candidatus Magasanikbacteria bacterium]PIR76836.1 MAG: hypothetical protein COU30_05730 [Candidatus Magasanikbacteria bacterium CG10_big_fil_rev_8_21_14_0_10_38_6]